MSSTLVATCTMTYTSTGTTTFTKFAYQVTIYEDEADVIFTLSSIYFFLCLKEIGTIEETDSEGQPDDILKPRFARSVVGVSCKV